MSLVQKPIDEDEMSMVVEMINATPRERHFQKIKEWRRDTEGLTIICYGPNKPIYFIPTGQYAMFSSIRKTAQ